MLNPGRVSGLGAGVAGRGGSGRVVISARWSGCPQCGQKRALETRGVWPQREQMVCCKSTSILLSRVAERRAPPDALPNRWTSAQAQECAIDEPLREAIWPDEGAGKR